MFAGIFEPFQNIAGFNGVYMRSSCSPPINCSVVSTEAGFIVPSNIDCLRKPAWLARGEMPIARPPIGYADINCLNSNWRYQSRQSAPFKKTDQCTPPTPKY